MATESGRSPSGPGSRASHDASKLSSPKASIPNAWLPIESAPMHTPILVAYHGHGVNHVAIVRRIKVTGHWGDYDYINSHDGEPKYWMPLPEPPDDIAGPNCGCDGCTEEYYGQDD